MIPQFLDRLTRFSPRNQVLLGILAGVLAGVPSLLVPTSLIGILIALLVLVPLVTFTVVLVASSVQKARNTVMITEVEGRLDFASNTHGVIELFTQKAPDPAWMSTLIALGKEERRVLAVGKSYAAIILNSTSDDVDDMIHPLAGRPELKPFEAGLRHLRELRAAHPTVANVETMRETENSLYMLVGKALTGVDIAAMRAQVDLDREFAVVADCENGHWAIHNLSTVFTARGGQRRVVRQCRCGSCWTEKI